MAPVYKTISELNAIFRDSVAQILGYVKTGSPGLFPNEAYKKVRFAWQKGGAPGWGVDDDVVFIRVVQIPDPYNLQREVISIDEGGLYKERMSYTRVLALQINVYGPLSWENGQSILDGFYDVGIREELGKSRVYPVPVKADLLRRPELWEGRWWERVDLSLNFNELVVREKDSGYFQEIVLPTVATN